MEKYSWWDFCTVTFLVLLVYYAFVFFRYYYPYLSMDNKGTNMGKGIPAKDGSGTFSEADGEHMSENPFIKNFNKTEKEEKIINNIVDSNNLDTFARNISDSPDGRVENGSLAALTSLFAGLPTVSEQEESEVEDEEPMVDLTDILPESVELDEIDMYVTEQFPEGKKDDDPELGAYLAKGLGEISFEFNK